MNNLTYDIFEMQMTSLAAYLHTSIESSLLKNEYWPYCKKYNTHWFNRAIQWVKENYEYKRFPLISDLSKAFSCTHSTLYVKDTPAKQEAEPDLPKDEIRQFMKKLSEKLTTPEQKKKKEVRNKQRNMYKRMDKEKMVWSYKRHKWVHEDLMGNIGGGFIIPREKLKEFKPILPEEKL